MVFYLPFDPLFIQIKEAFVKKQIEVYGHVTDIYNCDTFNENLPPTSDPTYILMLGFVVFEAISKANKNDV
nr:alpha-N-acetylglucosaminidase [Tanacetum cinerariifolium]